MAVELFGMAGSPNVRGAMLGLAAKGVDYELIPVAPPFKSPEHLERNPFGRVPAFEHDGFELYETQAILRYVDRTFPGPELQPTDPHEIARMDQILSIIDYYLSKAWSGAIGFERLIATRFFGRPADEKQIEEALPIARTCADALERLVSAPYLTGGSYTLADIRLVPHFDWFRRTPEGEEILAGKDGLAKWFDHVSARPDVQAVLQD